MFFYLQKDSFNDFKACQTIIMKNNSKKWAWRKTIQYYGLLLLFLIYMFCYTLFHCRWLQNSSDQRSNKKTFESIYWIWSRAWYKKFFWLLMLKFIRFLNRKTFFFFAPNLLVFVKQNSNYFGLFRTVLIPISIFNFTFYLISSYISNIYN